MKDETLESLLTNEIKIIFKYLIKIGATKEDAEDIVQDTLCKTIINIDSLDERKIVSWMFKVSINKYYNIYKENKKLNKYVGDLDDNVLRKMSTDTLTEEYILNDEYKEYVNKTLYALKPTYRNLLIMKYFMDLSYKEISKLLDFDEDKVKTYLYRARNKFKEAWEELNYGR
ncbi:RNA polymerase sigma factor [Inediibacterium massiliense]|uniref:RNA polymerase sigma factor n=1 Tax=Inediibacterium massiliense TaxID=1658111 RepID=UPI0006B42BC1|nr:RNA polymerase sigma factor [Inediibacterium massiliense]